MGDLKLELTQIFNAPVEKVWEAWADVEKMKQWMGPEGMKSANIDLDFRVGGKYRITMEPDGEGALHNETVIVGGSFIEIEKFKKLVYSWLWEGQPTETHTTLITLEFKKVDGNKTELKLTHKGFADEEMKKHHKIGWVSTFRKLKDFLD